MATADDGRPALAPGWWDAFDPARIAADRRLDAELRAAGALPPRADPPFIVDRPIDPGPSPRGRGAGGGWSLGSAAVARRERAVSGAAPVEKGGPALSSHCDCNAGALERVRGGGIDTVWFVDERDLIADRGTPKPREFAWTLPGMVSMPTGNGDRKVAPARCEVHVRWTTTYVPVDLGPEDIEGLKPIRDEITEKLRQQLEAESWLMLQTGWGLPRR